MTVTVLIVGATGFQGRAVIQSLVSLHDNPFHILALTRNSASPTAQSLLSVGVKDGKEDSQVELVQGNLDEKDSIRTIFEQQKEKGGIWGVFVALAFPGLGVNADGEQQQGIMLADLALEFKVSHFIYSSSERAGESFDDSMKLSGAAKVAIERHVKSLGDKGLSWTILRPTFFMENLQGSVGKIAVGVLKAGLKPETILQLIASEDIGHVAAAVFKKPETYKSQIIVILGDALTIQEQEEAYKRATGQQRPSIPWLLSKFIIRVNVHTRNLIAETERVFETRRNIEGGFAQLLTNVKEVYPNIMSYEDYIRKSSEVTVPSGWNKVSFMGILKGQS